MKDRDCQQGRPHDLHHNLRPITAWRIELYYIQNKT